MRLPRPLALALPAILAAAISAGSAQAAPSDRPRADLPPITLPEIPNDVAVANDGVTLVSFHDLKRLGIVAVDGTLSTLEIGCSPTAVEMAPAGDTGWAVCGDSTQIIAVDIAAKTTAVADEGLDNPVALAYSPATQQVVVGGYTGQITVISVTGPQDYAMVRTFPIGGTLSAITLSTDGLTGYSPNLTGAITTFNVATGATTTLSLANPRTYGTSVSLSPNGSTLFVGAGEQAADSSSITSVLLAVDPTTGRTLQRVPLTTSIPGFGSLWVAAAHRALYVGSGLGLESGATSSGVLSFGLDSTGRIGAGQPVFGPAETANALGLSRDGRYLAVGSVQSTLLRATEDNTPYPPALSITGALTSRGLAITGRSNGLSAGTSVTVYVKDLSKKAATYVAQKARATVTNTGTFTWKGSTSARKVSVYAGAGGVKSPAVTLTRR